MNTTHPSLLFFLNLAKADSVVTRKFDSTMNGLGFSDFMILFYLQQAREEKMRRVDLAEKIGLTASGVTRLLAPMEKIGMIKREANAQDARVSYVVLAPGGKRKLQETMEWAELLFQDLLKDVKAKSVKELADVLEKLS